MKTPIRSTRTNAPLALALAGALMAFALASPAQTAPEPPYTVTDVGANYRVWQRTVQVTNSATGEVTQQVQGYTELDAGMNYWTTNSAQSQGGWAQSQDLIEITPTGIQAIHGQMKAVISGDVTSTGAITLTTASGQVFQSRPLGLYYADTFSGKVAQVALVQPGRGLLYAPNVVVFTNAFSGLNADLILVWARNGFEQNVLLKQSPPPPETFGLSSASCRLQMWTAMDQCPEPVEDRPALLGSGLWDHILIFPDCWFPVGSAYVFGGAPLPKAGEAATVRPVSPSDQSAFPTAKSLVTIAGQKVLIEEINYSDLLSAFKGLGHASLPPSNPNAVEFAARGQLLPAPPATRHDRPILLAAGPYHARGIVLDYIQLSGSTNSCTFTSGTTYYIPTTYYQGPGTATFQNNACLKFASNAWLIAYGAVSFPSSGAPVVFTSKDDNAYGNSITNSTANPNYAASRALWLYYNGQMVTAQNALFRWSQYAVECDANPGANNAAIYSSAFEHCQTGVYVNMASDTLYLSGDTYCDVSSPVSINNGTVSGSMTLDCGVASVAMVNDFTQDTQSGDTNKNTECECTFILANDSSTIVAAFGDTHLSEPAFGMNYTFSNIKAARSTCWARSTDGGSSFANTHPLPPWGTSLTNTWWGDALNPVMTYDPTYPSGSSGTVYLLANPSREQTNWFGFRLWKSTDNGQSFTLINTNLPGGSSGAIECDRPMAKVDPSTHYLYAAGSSDQSTGKVVFAARSTTHGTSWDLYKGFETNAGQTDIVIKPNGPVYVFWVTFANTIGTNFTTRLRYAWLMPGSTSWSGPNDVGITLNSTGPGGDRYALRFKGDSSDDWFLVIPFPRAAYANNHIYLAYSDLPSANQFTTDQGDVFLAELSISPSDGSLTLTMSPRVVNNDQTQTDQWDAAIAANPQGTELFIGYYSRQDDPCTNSWIKAYGAKVYNIANGLANARIACFPISPTAFLPLYSGTNYVTNLQFDPIYPPLRPNNYTFLCYDQSARVDSLCTNVFCPPSDVHDVSGNSWFLQDDNTWADADTNYFYYAWCDRSRTWTWTALGVTNTRPDADVKLAKIRQ